MAVAYDTGNGSSTAASLGTRAATLTVANTPNRFAILTLSAPSGSGTASAVTLGALSFSLVSTVNYSTSVTSTVYVCYNPNVGTQTAVVAMAHSTSFGFLVSLFNGVDQTDGYSLQHTSSGSAAAVTATISTSTTDLVWAGFVNGGGQGDGSVTCTGATQLNTIVVNNSGRMEHHTYAPAGTTATVAYATVAGNYCLRWAANIKAASTTPTTAPTYTLPLTGAGS